MSQIIISKFITRLTEVSGEYVKVDTPQGIAATLLRFLKENGLTTIALSKDIFTDEDKQILSSQAEITIDFDLEDKPSNAEAVNLVGQAKVGISCAYALISDIGSVVLRSQFQGDRLCSTLPEVNVVVWEGVKIFPTAAEFYAELDPDLTYTLIAGPSRTADIEKTLVLGAHGPRRLIVFGP